MQFIFIKKLLKPICYNFIKFYNSFFKWHSRSYVGVYIASGF